MPDPHPEFRPPRAALQEGLAGLREALGKLFGSMTDLLKRTRAQVRKLRLTVPAGGGRAWQDVGRERRARGRDAGRLAAVEARLARVRAEQGRAPGGHDRREQRLSAVRDEAGERRARAALRIHRENRRRERRGLAPLPMSRRGKLALQEAVLERRRRQLEGRLERPAGPAAKAAETVARGLPKGVAAAAARRQGQWRDRAAAERQRAEQLTGELHATNERFTRTVAEKNAQLAAAKAEAVQARRQLEALREETGDVPTKTEREADRAEAFARGATQGPAALLGDLLRPVAENTVAGMSRAFAALGHKGKLPALTPGPDGKVQLDPETVATLRQIERNTRKHWSE